MSLGRKVFVIHGRDKRARRELFAFLRAIGLAPVEWPQALAEAGGGAPLIGDILDKAIGPDRAILVLLTPDDIAQLLPEHADDDDDPDVRPSGQARPNVLFEAGMAIGRYPEHTVLVEFGKVRPFTDVAGRFIVKLNDTSQSRNKLALLLEKIGCEVDLSGTDWHTAGDLTPPGSKSIGAELPVATGTPKSGAPSSGNFQPEFVANSGTRDLEMCNFSSRRRGRELLVDGEIVNNEDNALTLALKATFYSSSGGIIGSADGLINALAPRERRAFELTTYDKVGPFSRVNVHIETAFEV